MFELKSDHIHSIQESPHQVVNESGEVTPIKKKMRKVRIKTLPTNDPNQHFYADVIIPQLESSMSDISGPVFDAISLVRKNIEFQVYTSIVDNQEDYLKRMFNNCDQDSTQYWIRSVIHETANEVQGVICQQILNGDYDVKKVNKITKDDIFGNKTSEAVVKIRQQMLKAKILSLKSDLSNSSLNISSNDILNPNSSDLYGPQSQRTKKATDFVRKMKKQQEQIKQHYKRIQQNQKYRKKQIEQQKRQIQLRLKQQKHQFLKHQYNQKRKLKQNQRMEQKKKQEKFLQFMKEHNKSKPLFKQKQQQFFKKYLIPENKRKLQILKEIRQEHQPLQHDDLKQHQRQYLQIKEDHMYQKNAALAVENRVRKPQKIMYRSKFHSQIEKEQKNKNQQFQDPLEEKTKLYQKRWQYATEIKTKFLPKTSPKKREQSLKWQEQVQSVKNSHQRGRDGYKIDGKQNLDRLHKYIAELKAKGKIRYGSASHTIEHETKTKYKNYLRDLGVSRQKMRHSIDYSSLAQKDSDKLRFDLKKIEENAVRREQYLTHLGSHNMQQFMKQKKQLDDDYLNTVRAKAALINQF